MPKRKEKTNWNQLIQDSTDPVKISQQVVASMPARSTPVKKNVDFGASTGNLVQDSLNPVWGANQANFEVEALTPWSFDTWNTERQERVNNLMNQDYTNRISTYGFTPMQNERLAENAKWNEYRQANVDNLMNQDYTNIISNYGFAPVQNDQLAENTIRAVNELPYYAKGAWQGAKNGVLDAYDYISLWLNEYDNGIYNATEATRNAQANQNLLWDADPFLYTMSNQEKPIDEATYQAGKVAQKAARDAQVQELYQEVADRIESGELSEGTMKAVNYAVTIGRMSPAIVLHAIPYVGKVLSDGYLFTSAGGNAYYEAVNEGATHDEAMFYGGLVGAAELVIEKATGGIPGLGSGYLDNFLPQGGVAGYVANILSEGTEESVSTLLNPVLKRIAYNPDAEWATGEEVLNSFIDGAVVSAVLGAPGQVKSTINQMPVNVGQFTPRDWGKIVELQMYKNSGNATKEETEKIDEYIDEVNDALTEQQNGDNVNLEDIQIGQSIGAKAKNYDVVAPNGEVFKITEGSSITDVQVIAGNGRNRQIDIIDILVDEFGGDPFKWQKCKGFAYLDVDGESLRAEVHWYQEPNTGKVVFKIKPQQGGEWFIYED